MEKIDIWVKENQGKHICKCGCEKAIKVLRRHHYPTRGIPEFIRGHQVKGVEEWIKENQGKHFCKCGCGEPVEIKWWHHQPSGGIPEYILGHQVTGTETEKWVTENQRKHFCQCGCNEPIVIKYWYHVPTRGIPQFLPGHNPNDETTRKKISERSGESRRDPNSVFATKEYKEKIGQASKRAWDNPSSGLHFRPEVTEETKRKISENNSGSGNPMWGRHHSEESKKKLQKSSLKLWRSPEFIEKWVKGRDLRPNKPETKLGEILESLFPGEYRYTGDFSMIIGGKNPDFFNQNGQKKLVELYGDYWHAGQDPQTRIDHFKKFGFDTLVIWENELKNIGRLKQTLTGFHHGKA